MKIEIQAIHFIKPSSPTPGHLRHHTLSLIDQLAPPVYMPQFYFYPKDDVNYTTKRDRLMFSLANALTRFYPLAGRAKDNHIYIECSDEGAHFSEARVMCPLSTILENPMPGELNKLCPFQPTELNEIPLAVQLNVFDCGGVAVGISMSHKVADGLSFLTFVSSWAAIARGDLDETIATPSFESATVFPPKPLSYFQNMSTGIVKEGIVAKRFVFDAKAINTLRTTFAENEDAIIHGNNRRSTRVEALSAFLWSRYMASTQPEGGHPEKLYSILHAVNLRPRTDPPLSDRHFGNMTRIAISVPGPKAQGFEIVREARDAIRQVNADYVKKLIDASERHVGFMKQRSNSIARGEVVPFSFTSLCRFPIYGLDFGWGKPMWVGLGAFPFRNLVVLIDANSGDGIEAYVHLKEEEMVMLEKDAELLGHVTENSVMKTAENKA